MCSASGTVDFTARSHMHWPIQDLPKKGTVASARIASLNGGLEPQAGSRGRVPGGEFSSPTKLKLFVHFHTKKWPKVKDLNENLPPCLRQTASRIQDQRYGGWRLPVPLTAGSATAHMARPLDPSGVFLRPLFCYPKQIPGYIRPCLTKFKTPFIWEVYSRAYCRRCRDDYSRQ